MTCTLILCIYKFTVIIIILINNAVDRNTPVTDWTVFSQVYEAHPYTLQVGHEHFTVRYTPGESDSGAFGGNSNWRGPVWVFCKWYIALPGSWDNLLVECWTHDWKVVSSNPGRSSRRTFFSRVNFLCWPLFGVCSTPVLPQWHVKDPGHSAKSAGGRLHLNMHTPLTQRGWSGLTMLLSRHSVGTYQETSSCNLSGNIQPQSSQLAEPLWTNPCAKSGISVRKLISTFKKKRRLCQGMNVRTFSQNPSKWGKGHTLLFQCSSH